MKNKESRIERAGRYKALQDECFGRTKEAAAFFKKDISTVGRWITGESPIVEAVFIALEYLKKHGRG
ncbi:MAG TPA: hypothetical protein VIC51_06125 [Psychromonas sp.]